MKALCSKRGFTLVEMLIVMGLLVSATAVIIPISVKLLRSNRTESVAKSVYSDTFLTQQNAYTGLGNTNHGIAFFVNRYEIYTGNSLSEATSKEIVYLPNNVSIININFNTSNEVRFARGAFRPVADGSFIVSDASNSYLITINKEGAIFYEKI